MTTAQQAGIRERVRATRDMEAVRELGMQGGANVVVDVHVEHKRSNAAGSGLKEWINATAVGTKGSGADGEVWLVAEGKLQMPGQDEQTHAVADYKRRMAQRMVKEAIDRCVHEKRAEDAIDGESLIVLVQRGPQR